jgi:hypothetical protein
MTPEEIDKAAHECADELEPERAYYRFWVEKAYIAGARRVIKDRDAHIDILAKVCEQYQALQAKLAASEQEVNRLIYELDKSRESHMKVIAAQEAKLKEYYKECANLRAKLEKCSALGKWMSAALSDPEVCNEMKQDIEIYFEGCQDHLV